MLTESLNAHRALHRGYCVAGAFAVVTSVADPRICLFYVLFKYNPSIDFHVI